MTTVVIPVYDEVTQLDFTAPHQFLSMVPDIKIIVASVGGTFVSSQGLAFDKLADLESIDECDVVCVPGGLGCIRAMEDSRFLPAVRRLGSTAQYVTSVCSGSLILGAAELLKGRRQPVTGHGATCCQRLEQSPMHPVSSVTEMSLPEAALLRESTSP